MELSVEIRKVVEATSRFFEENEEKPRFYLWKDSMNSIIENTRHRDCVSQGSLLYLMDWQLNVDSHWTQLDRPNLTWQYNNLRHTINHVLKRMEMTLLLEKLDALRTAVPRNSR